MPENFEKFNNENEVTPEKPGDDIENKQQEYYDAFSRTTISVKEMIPEINIDGLTLRTSDTKELSRRFIDSSDDREIVNLPSQLATPFAPTLYSPENLLEAWGVKKQDPQMKRSEEMKKAMEEIFKGQIVVDLGSGSTVFGYLIADRAKAKGYVAVEPVFARDLLYELTNTLNPELASDIAHPTKPKHKLNKIPVAIVEEDMLGFLKRLPDNSVSILNSGVDKFVIPDKAYRNAVAQEIMRVMSPEGGYVGQQNMHIKLPKSENIAETTIEIESEDKKSFSNAGIHVYKKLKKPE